MDEIETAVTEVREERLCQEAYKWLDEQYSVIDKVLPPHRGKWKSGDPVGATPALRLTMQLMAILRAYEIEKGRKTLREADSVFKEDLAVFVEMKNATL